MGIYPDITIREKKITLKTVAIAVRSIVRMSMMAEQWRPVRALREKLDQKVEEARRLRDARSAGVDVSLKVKDYGSAKKATR